MFMMNIARTEFRTATPRANRILAKPPMPAPRTAVADAGDGYCPQCETSHVKVFRCKSTDKEYCSLHNCKKKAGVPSVVSPKRRKRNKEEASDLLPLST